MIETNALREKVLDLAIRGKLVPQDPNDEPSSVLLERIRAEKQRMVKDGMPDNSAETPLPGGGIHSHTKIRPGAPSNT